MHERGPLRQPLRQHPGSAADLQHHILVGERGQPLDHVEDVAVDEEVLPELYQPNTAAEAASTSRLKSW